MLNFLDELRRIDRAVRGIAISRNRWLYLILLLALILRIYHLNYPAWDYHNWRQTITLMVARDYARHGFHLFHPQVLWVSHDRPSDPSYFSGEFSIQSVIAAILYKVFGESDATARIVTIAFSLLGIYFLYDLLNRRAGPLAARLGALVYALVPYHLFFGRVFMPDVPSIALALGGLDWLDRWTDDRKWNTLFVASFLTALAILQKLTVIVVAWPMLYLFWHAYGRHLAARIEPYVLAAIAGLPSLAWYSHAANMAQVSGFSIAPPISIIGSHLGLWLQSQFVIPILKALAVEAFSPFGLGLAAIGLFWPTGGRAAATFRFWIAGAASLLFLIPDNLSENHYYLSLLLPGGAALVGLFLARFGELRGGAPILALLLVLFASGAIRSAVPLYQADRLPRDLGIVLNRLTAPQDLIVTESGGSPNILYFADRRGWMLNRNYEAAVLDRLAEAGAHYYADTFPADVAEHRDFFRALDTRFKRLTPEDAPQPIYQLVAAPAHPLPKNPASAHIARMYIATLAE